MSDTKNKIISYLKSAGFKKKVSKDGQAFYIKSARGINDTVIFKKSGKLSMARVKQPTSAAAIEKNVASVDRFKYLYNKLKEAILVLEG